VSSQASGREADVRAIREGAARVADSGVEHADLLVVYAEALVAHDDGAIAELRQPMIDALGAGGSLEAVTVAANFQRMVRIADATGIPQDGAMMTLVGDLADRLSLRDFASAANTPEIGWLQRMAGKALRPFSAALMTFAAKRLNAAAAKEADR